MLRSRVPLGSAPPTCHTHPHSSTHLSPAHPPRSLHSQCLDKLEKALPTALAVGVPFWSTASV